MHLHTFSYLWSNKHHNLHAKAIWVTTQFEQRTEQVNINEGDVGCKHG